MIAKGGRLLLGYLAETILSTRDGPDHDKRLLAGCNSVGKWGVGRLVGEVFFACEQAQAKTKNARRCCVSRSRWIVLGMPHAAWDSGSHFLLTTRIQHRALRGRAWFSE